LRLAIALFFQILANTGEGATSTGCANETVNITLGLFPYFGPSRDIVRVRIGGIIELVCPYGILKLFGILLRLVVIVQRILVGDCRYWVHFGTEHSEKVDLLLALNIIALARKMVAA
jgi:hypothetical protein